MKRILSLILVLVLVLGSMPMAFADENMTGGENLYELGLVKGDAEGNLMEDQMLTREQMMVMLARVNDVEGEAMDYDLPSTFNDVNADSYYAPYIAYAEVQEWTNGTGDGTFSPNAEVTAQMVATYMLRVLGYEVNWDTAVAEAAVLGIMDDTPSEKFLRGNAFDMMYDAVNTKMANSEMTLGQKLGKIAMEEEVVAEDVAIDSAVALNSQVVEVSLDGDMDAPEMVDASIFMVTDEDDAELAIESAVFAGWDADNYTVLVRLDEALTAGEAYTVASGDSSVAFGGMGVDDTDPAIDDVTSADYNKVEITFTEAFDIADVMVTITEKYGDKDELAVLDMEYSGSDKLVVTTSEQADSTLYEVEVDGLADLAGNSVNDLTDTFTGQAMDTDEQTVLNATAQDSVTVDVEFRTKVNQDAALDAANYTITEKYGDKDEVVVASVEMKLDSDDEVVENKVVLTLATDTNEATLYTLAVENVGTLYGEALDTDNDEVSFTGKGEDTDEPSAVDADALNNTEVKITVTDDSYIAEEFDVALFSIIEKYGDKDELVVVAVKEVDAEAKTITLTTSEQSEATLYELTVAEGLADKFGNVTTDELTATFTGAGVADEIKTVTATNTKDRKVQVDFDQNYGDGALSVINYKIDGGIGYPTKVEEIDTDDNSVLLTVSELEIGTIYELTVNNVDNSDGVAMDADGVTDKFAGKSGSSDVTDTLEAVVATDNQTIKLYFDKDVADVAGIADADTLADEFDLKYEGGATVPLSGYGYIDPNNDKVYVVTASAAGTFANDDGDEITLIVNNAAGHLVDIDTEDSANEVLFAENTSTPDDIVVEGVVALDDQTLRVYFNQTVRNIDSTVSNFANVTDADGEYSTLTNAYYNNDEKTEWIFVMGTQMDSDTASKLDFVVDADAEIAGQSIISTHTLGSSKVEYSGETGDDTVEFSKNTESTDYMDNIGVTMLDSKTVKVFFPENMNTTAADDDKSVVDASVNVYDFDTASDGTGGNPTNANEGNITQVVWDKDTNSAILTLNAAFGTTDGTKLYLGFADTLANKAGNKTVKNDDDSQLWVEFSVSTADAALVSISDVTATSATSGGSIVIELDQPATSSGALTINELLADFDVVVDGESLVATDILSVSKANDDLVSEDAALNADDSEVITITLKNAYTDLDVNSTVEVEIIDDTTTDLGGLYNGELLDIDATGVTSAE